MFVLIALFFGFISGNTASSYLSVFYIATALSGITTAVLWAETPMHQYERNKRTWLTTEFLLCLFIAYLLSELITSMD